MGSSPFFLLIVSSVLLMAGAFGCLAYAWRLDAKGKGALGSRILTWTAWGLVCGIALTAFSLWSDEQKIGKADAQQFFETEADRIQQTVRSTLQQYEDVLRGSAQFLASERPDPSLWQRYVSSLSLAKRFPNVFGMGFAAYVSQADSRRWTITPPGERYDYFVIQLAEPAGQNKGLIGYDLGSELSARTAAERARDSSSSALTGKMILLDDPQERAFLLFWPVFRNQVSLQGWTFLRFRSSDILRGLLPTTSPSFTLQVYDGPLQTKEALFYSSSGVQDPILTTRFSVMKVIDVAGRPWTLGFSAEKGFENAETRTRALALALLGSVLFLGGLGGLWSFASSRRRAGKLAEELTASLREREKALTAGPYGILLVDAIQPGFPIVYVNPRFERITGYTASDALGQNPRFLYKEDTDQRGLDELRLAVRELRETKVLLRNYRKDGTPFWNELTVTPIRNDQGRLTHFAGVIQDVTEREQSERRLTTQMSVIRALAESPGVEQASRNILQSICENQGWDVGTLWRVDVRAQILRCVDVWSLPDVKSDEFEKFVRETTYPKEMGLPGMVWARGEALWFSDVVKEGKFPEASIIAKQGLNGACAFPISGAQGIIGVMAFYSRRLWPLNKNLMLLMAGTASQISQGMEVEKAVFQQRELTALERGMAEFLGEGLMAMDRDGYCIYVNASAAKLLHTPSRQLLGKHLPDTLQPDRAGPDGIMEAGTLRLTLQLTTPKHFFHNQYFHRPDGTVLPVSLTASPIIDKGMIQGVVITFLDSSEYHSTLEEQQKRLEAQEKEIQHLKEALHQAQKVTTEGHPSQELLGKIRNLLKDIE